MKMPKNAFDTYKCIKTVGKGSFGTAYLVEDPYGNQLVMKKIELQTIPQFNKTEAINEVKNMAKVSKHPFLVKYKEAFVCEDSLCILMEYCSGGELQSKIKKFQVTRSVFPESALKRWLTQLAMGLQFLHKNKLLHRDLKSANIFLDSKNQIRLGDFGLSKHLNFTLAKAKTFCGTPLYMAPEVCKHELYDSSADMWALGVVMYEMATLSFPFQATSLPILFYKVCNDPKSYSIALLQTPVIPSKYSKELRKICVSLLNKDPKKRLTASQVLQSPILQDDIKIVKKQNSDFPFEKW